MREKQEKREPSDIQGSVVPSPCRPSRPPAAQGRAPARSPAWHIGFTSLEGEYAGDRRGHALPGRWHYSGNCESTVWLHLRGAWRGAREETRAHLCASSQLFGIVWPLQAFFLVSTLILNQQKSKKKGSDGVGAGKHLEGRKKDGTLSAVRHGRVRWGREAMSSSRGGVEGTRTFSFAFPKSIQCLP